MRVSLSAFLRISEGDSYILVRSLHRKEAFGPFGGVYKYFSSAGTRLDELQFRPQGINPEMRNDLRGFLPRRYLLRFLRWFDEGKEREDAANCLFRELREEIREVRLAQEIAVPEMFSCRRVRRVQEGPSIAAGQKYTQYRIFDVYEIIEPNKEMVRFLSELRSSAVKHKDLLVASAKEIIAGRSNDDRIIGHHAGYLFQRKRVRPDEPMFVEPRGARQ